jgi:hypothetical protein
MKARPLVISLSLFTCAVWIAYASTFAKNTLTLPLLAFMPQSEWTEKGSPLLLVGLLAYSIIPVIAYLKKSKGLAWLIPLTPLLGIAIFFVRFGVGMKAFN